MVVKMSVIMVAITLTLAIIGSVALPFASADQMVITISNLTDTTMPGCEETEQCFEPSTATIDVGYEVVWSNDGMTTHAITSGTLRDSGPDGVFNSGLLGPGEAFSHTFTETGDYPYFCILHPWMNGKVVVQDPPVAHVTESTITDGYDPATVTIKVGGKVVWNNDDGLLHTVTSGSLADGGPDGIFNSGPLKTHEVFSHTFTETGDYPYFCILHPWLTGRVIVQESVDEPPKVRLTLDAPTPHLLEGDSILISGRLTIDGQAIIGQAVLIREGHSNSTLISLATDNDGAFGWVMTPHLGDHEVFATYENHIHKHIESARHGIQVDSHDIPDNTHMTLITLEQTSKATDDTMTFTGSLTSNGAAVPNKIVWIHVGDDLYRITGYGVTDMLGEFAIQLTGVELPEASEAYAVFGGDSWYGESQSMIILNDET